MEPAVLSLEATIGCRRRAAASACRPMRGIGRCVRVIIIVTFERVVGARGRATRFEARDDGETTAAEVAFA
jgi:hypothetical protein